MHYHSSSKYLSKTESVDVSILPFVFHLKLQQELVSRRGERSGRFWALVGLCFHYECRTTLCITLWDVTSEIVGIIGLFATVTLLDQLRHEKMRSPLPFPLRALRSNLKVLIKCQQAECRRQEGDNQGNNTNTSHLSVAVTWIRFSKKKKK